MQIYKFTTFQQQQKLGVEGWVALFHSKALQVFFWNIEIYITGSCVCIVLVLFKFERDNGSEKRKISSFLIAKVNEISFY